MAVHIRLQRIGRRKRPFYRVVIMDSRTRRDGREIERIGWYDPLKENDSFSYDEERAIHWLKEGATPSDRVNFLFKSSGLNLKWHLIQTGASEEEIENQFQAWQDNKAQQEQLKAEKAAAKAAAAVAVEEEASEETEEEATEEDTTEKTLEPEPEADAEAPAEEAEAAADEVVEET